MPAWPTNFDKQSLIITTNKDGRVAWRPISLLNPVVYVYLVRLITTTDNWEKIVGKLRRTNRNIICASLPMRGGKNAKKNKASQISKYHEEFEQASVKLSLKYSWISDADITNFYGSIYTHALAWAIDGKQASKKIRGNSTELGAEVDRRIGAFQYGQTNGIPQGSVLMDLFAELLLTYIDRKLSKRISKSKLLINYRILRYRDDYRIFSTSQENVLFITEELARVLRGLNLSLNSAKTSYTNDVLEASIKDAKIHAIASSLTSAIDLSDYKCLLVMREFDRLFPNSGQLTGILLSLGKRVKSGKLQKRYAWSIIAICLDIMKRSPKHLVLVLNIVVEYSSRALIGTTRKRKLITALESVRKQMPYSDMMDIWFYRIYKVYDFKLPKEFKNHPLNRVAMGKLGSLNEIWNYKPWVNPDLEALMDSQTICPPLAVILDSVQIDIREYVIFES